MATPVIKKSTPKTVSPSILETPAEVVVVSETTIPEATVSEVRSILSKITLVNPYTKAKAMKGELASNIIVDSWWESQVSAGLALWK